MFKVFDLKKIKAKGKGKIARIYKCRDKRALAQKIFLRYLYLLLNDLIGGGKMFHFPSKHMCCIKMIKIEGEEFKKFRKRGFFRKVDFLISNFSGYFLAMEYINRVGRKKTKHIVLSKNMADEILRKTNEGFRYC